MQCKKCGTEIKEGCLFCHQCGEAVQIVPDYEPEMEELKIQIPKKEHKTQELPKEEQVPKKFHWRYLVLGGVLILGSAAFLTAYSFVLKSQEPGAMRQEVKQEKDEISRQIQKPVFSLPGGEYTYYISVELTAEEEDRIYYTMDGSVPTEDSMIYEKSLSLSEGTTVVRALAVDENGNSSEVASEVYVIEFGAPDLPVVIPETGTYQGEQYIKILVPDGCAAYYTLDGSDPTGDSELYTGEFLMPEGTTTVRVVLENKSGMISEINTLIYTCIPEYEEPGG